MLSLGFAGLRRCFDDRGGGDRRRRCANSNVGLTARFVFKDVVGFLRPADLSAFRLLLCYHSTDLNLPSTLTASPVPVPRGSKVESGERTPLLLRCLKDASAVVSPPQETNSDGPRTLSVKARSRSLHLVLWFEDEQIPPPKRETGPPAARINAGEKRSCSLRVGLDERNSLQAVVLISD